MLYMWREVVVIVEVKMRGNTLQLWANSATQEDRLVS